MRFHLDLDSKHCTDAFTAKLNLTNLTYIQLIFNTRKQALGTDIYLLMMLSNNTLTFYST